MQCAEVVNNVAEREMKRIAIGRKNWMTVGSPRGGQTAAIHFSFMSTCPRLGVEPWRYLRDVLERLPRHLPERLGAQNFGLDGEPVAGRARARLEARPQRQPRLTWFIIPERPLRHGCQRGLWRFPERARAGERWGLMAPPTPRPFVPANAVQYGPSLRAWSRADGT